MIHNKLFRNIFYSFLAVTILWLVFFIDIVYPGSFNEHGIVPRTREGFWGIFFAPFLHGNVQHLLSNSGPLFVLTLVLLMFYENLAFKVWTSSIFLGGFLVWIFGREATHIGASGLIFSLIGFFLGSGLFRGSFKSLFIAVAIFFLYGGILWGVLPNQEGISWEGHLFGAIAGGLIAWRYRNIPEYTRNRIEGGF